MKRWFAVYTKAKQEQIALENLQQQGFSCFLPKALNPFQRLTKGKTRIDPLFPRYIFLRADSSVQNLSVIRSTRGVCSLVRFGNLLATVPDKVITMIKAKADQTSGLITLQPPELESGDEVRVYDGPMAGINGIFKSYCGVQRALLLLELMGRITTVEVDALSLQTVI